VNIQKTSRCPGSPDHENTLIERAKQGDRNAFGELIIQHRAGVINIVYRLCGDAELAEDAAQEAFIKAWLKLNQYKPSSHFRNWMYRIATNTVLDILRRQRKTVEIEPLPIASPLSGPETTLENQERTTYIQNAVLALSPASRVVLVLREYERLSYQEIANTLDIPLGTVMSRLNYARSQLRQSLATYLETK
jgi:RNA polymerase sigma-70 factor (ECF subfamily)